MKMQFVKRSLLVVTLLGTSLVQAAPPISGGEIGERVAAGYTCTSRFNTAFLDLSASSVSVNLSSGYKAVVAKSYTATRYQQCGSCAPVIDPTQPGNTCTTSCIECCKHFLSDAGDDAVGACATRFCGHDPC